MYTKMAEFVCCTRHHYQNSVAQPTHLILGHKYCSFCAQHCSQNCVPIRTTKPFKCECVICEKTDADDVKTSKERLQLLTQKYVEPFSFMIGRWFSIFSSRFQMVEREECDLITGFQLEFLLRTLTPTMQDLRDLAQSLKPRHSRQEPKDEDDPIMDSNLYFFHPPICVQCKSIKLKPLQKIISNNVHVTLEPYLCTECNITYNYTRTHSMKYFCRSRHGRCGEFSQLFANVCYQLGWKYRMIISLRDHVWVEVFIEQEDRYVHCDPSEGIVDKKDHYKGENHPNYLLSLDWIDGKLNVTDVTHDYTKQPQDRDLFEEQEWTKALDVLNYVLQ